MSDRARTAERALERQLLRQFPDFSDNALGFLLAEARKTPEWIDHVGAGMSLDITGLVESLVRSDLGEMIFRGEGTEEGGSLDDDLADLADMPRHARMTWARAKGLG